VPDTEAAERMGLAARLAALSGVAVRTGDRPAAAAEEVAREIGDAEVVCVALGRVDAAVLDAAPRLRLVAKCGIGVDNIDVAAAHERGLTVIRAAGVNFRGVAEYVIGAAIAGLRQFVRHDAGVRSGRWLELRAECAGLLPALAGKTLGIAGLGSIGAETARLALAHGMEVVAHDPYRAEGGPVRLVSKEELFAGSDVVSLHLLLTDETHHYTGERELAAMKPDALLVNTSRGPVVDERALADALRERRIAGAAVDVLELEPPASDNPLLALDNVLLTPHLAGCTDLGYQEIGKLTARNVERFLAGEPLPQECLVT
jgi:D-3-phosphoglycerate dehydrogenase